ncbi:hypothetical protein ACVJ5M_003825 [Bradyrhizobium sp. S3.7.6]
MLPDHQLKFSFKFAHADPFILRNFFVICILTLIPAPGRSPELAYPSLFLLLVAVGLALLVPAFRLHHLCREVQLLDLLDGERVPDAR